MNHGDTLGVCPDCEAAIPRSRLLVEYEVEGQPATFAECPGCHGIVAPDPGSPDSVGPDHEINEAHEELRLILGSQTETMAVGPVIFVGRTLTIDEKKALSRQLDPERMKNLVMHNEARVEL